MEGRPSFFLSSDGFIGLVRNLFSQMFSDPRRKKGSIPLEDFFMSAYALAALKFSSLLSFDHSARQKELFSNLQRIFGVKRVPSDTQLRDILDRIDFSPFRDLFEIFWRELQKCCDPPIYLRVTI